MIFFCLSISLSTYDSGVDRESSMGTEPIITWKDFQKTMPWEIVILVGGGYALASGSKVTLQFCFYGSNVGPEAVLKDSLQSRKGRLKGAEGEAKCHQVNKKGSNKAR